MDYKHQYESMKKMVTMYQEEVVPGLWEKIKELEKQVPKWIPVTERLPDSQADVLVVAFWHEKWQTMIGWHSDLGQKWRVITPHGEHEPGGVTHWMPLPEPPKENDNE